MPITLITCSFSARKKNPDFFPRRPFLEKLFPAIFICQKNGWRQWWTSKYWIKFQIFCLWNMNNELIHNICSICLLNGATINYITFPCSHCVLCGVSDFETYGIIWNSDEFRWIIKGEFDSFGIPLAISTTQGICFSFSGSFRSWGQGGGWVHYDQNLLESGHQRPTPMVIWKLSFFQVGSL